MTGLLSVEDALSRVLSRATALAAGLATEVVSLQHASGRVLAEAAVAAVDLPPFPSSAMDGFAIRAADSPGSLPVVGEVAAGRPSGAALGPGQAVSIATGGAVLEGADAVVPFENVVHRDDTIEISSAVAVGANVRARGGDVRAGEDAVPAGTRLTPARVAALAACGVAEVRCAARPRVVVLSTGTELRQPGAPLRAGEIYESNSIMLEAALRAAGAEVYRLGPVPDDEPAHRAAIERGLEADVLITTGGVSVGPHDLVRRVEAALGVEEIFWGVAMRPGKPVAFGIRDGTLVFGLPGNPVSSLVGYHLFVRPAVAAMQGDADPGPHFSSGVLTAAARRTPARDDFLRAVAATREHGVELTPTRGQESHMIVRSAAANALVQIPRGEDVVPAGGTVRYLPI